MIFRRSRKLAWSRDRCHLLSFLPTSRAGRAFDGRARGHLREEAMLVKCAVEHLLQKRGKKLVKCAVDNVHDKKKQSFEKNQCLIVRDYFSFRSTLTLRSL
jgi:hypothetical protein